MHTFKAGDRVRRTVAHAGWPQRYPRGHEFTIISVGDVGVWDDTEVYHDSKKLELFPLLTTAEKLAEAEAQVEALKAQLAAENAPKVGQTYYIAKHHIQAVVQELFEGVVWYRFRIKKVNGNWTDWEASRRSMSSFNRDYKLVEDTGDLSGRPCEFDGWV